MMVDLSARSLRGTDLHVSPLVLGTMTFGAQLDEAGSQRVIHRARELGVTMLDGSNSYGGGRSEEIIGRAVKPFRDEVQVVTKVGAPLTGHDPDAPRLDRTSVLRECDASLERLGVEHIDLYYLHKPDRSTPLEETLAACQELLEAGKIRHLGISNHAAWKVADAMHLAEANGWPRVRVAQPMYNLVSRRLEDEYADCTAHFRISNLVYNPLAGGLLTGKHRPDDGPAEGTRFANLPGYVDRYWTDALFRAVDQLRSIADEAGLTLIELAFRWLLTQAPVAGVILGVSSIEQLETNIAAADGPDLDAATLTSIDNVWTELRGPAPSHNQ